MQETIRHISIELRVSRFTASKPAEAVLPSKRCAATASFGGGRLARKEAHGYGSTEAVAINRAVRGLIDEHKATLFARLR